MAPNTSKLSLQDQLERLCLSCAIGFVPAPLAMRPDGGGGSAAVFTLSPPAAAAHGVGPGDLLVDDAVNDGVLTIGIRVTSLGLPMGTDILGLSGGRDNGLPTMLEYGNAMNWPHLVYQESVDPFAVDDFTSPSLTIPKELPLFFPVITHTTDFRDKFVQGRQEGSVFFNREILAPTLPSARFNGLTMDPGMLELGPNDDVDDFDSVGGIGGGPDANLNGMLDPGVRVYFTLAGGSSILFKDSTTPPGAAPTVFATRAQLGLAAGDVIDAIAVWDVGTIGVFDPPLDRVVFSLQQGSASITPNPIVLAGDPYSVPIDEGGAILAEATPMGSRWIAALPGNYFSLSASDELDGLMALDPRENVSYCLGAIQRPVVDARSLVMSRWRYDMPMLSMATPTVVAINDTSWLPAGMLDSYNVQITIDPPLARILGAGTMGACGPGGCCGGCWSGSVPACPGGVAGMFFACGLNAMLPRYDACLGEFYLQTLAPGDATLTINGSVTMMTAGGPVTTQLVPSTADIHVFMDCNGNGMDDAIECGKGLLPDCNQNGIPDTCEWPNGFPDCNGNGMPDPCDIANAISADCNANGVPDECDISAAIDFTFNPTSTPLADSEIALGDLDGDGDLDLALSSDAAPSFTVGFNNGSGVFGSFATTNVFRSQSGVVVADLDGDGDSDIALSHPSSNDVSVLRNNGAGVFTLFATLPVGNAPYGIAVGDLDGDGDLDLVTADIVDDTVSILRNNGNATFAAATTVAVGDGPIQVALADLDGDGDRDLVTADRFGNTVTVRRNNGNATFAPSLTFAVGSGPFSMIVADVGGPAGPEVVLSSDSSRTVQVLDNPASPSGSIRWTWTAPSGVPGRLAVGDFDLDGDTDIALGGSSSGPIRILRLQSNGALGPVFTISAWGSVTAVASGSLNGDALIDLAAIRSTSADDLVTLIRNLTASTSYDCNTNGVPDECDLGGIFYCVGKQNSQGCMPVIATSGLPSATCMGPFTIFATNIISNKPGILLYGYAPAATPFQGATLCINPPVRRTNPQNSGGVFPPNNCTGTFSYDFNALIRSGTNPLLVAGTGIFSQYWYRDPPAAFGSGLSNAVSFVIGP